MKGKGDVRGSPSEHVGQDEYSGAMLDLGDTPLDLPARVVDVIVPSNGHGLDMRDFAHDHFGRSHEFVSELTMGHR